MKSLLKSIAVLIVVLIIALVVWLGYQYVNKKRTPLFTPIDSSIPTGEQQATSTISLFGADVGTTASSTLDTSSWKTYTHDTLGFQVSYPSDLILNGDQSSTILAFPKETYFSWPLLDDVKITIAASSTCPSLLNDTTATSSSVELNGYTFARHISQDVAAGNRYVEILYTTTSQEGICYSIYLFDHGSNGAGLYVDDQVFIKRYDDAHTTHMKTIIELFNAVVTKFRIVGQL